jgi:hypothetical protein
LPTALFALARTIYKAHLANSFIGASDADELEILQILVEEAKSRSG